MVHGNVRAIGRSLTRQHDSYAVAVSAPMTCSAARLWNEVYLPNTERLVILKFSFDQA